MCEPPETASARVRVRHAAPASRVAAFSQGWVNAGVPGMRRVVLTEDTMAAMSISELASLLGAIREDPTDHRLAIEKGP